MASDLSPFVVYPGGVSPRTEGRAPAREHQELWFSMARLQWASLVLVPVEPGGSAAEVATALAQVGTQLRDTPVTAVVANRIDFASARALAELQPRLLSGSLEQRWEASIEVEAHPVEPNAPPANGTHHAALLPPIGRAVIAIQSVLDEPLGVAVAQAADAVAICIQLGKTRLDEARRTIELIGADRVIGAVIVK